MWSFYLMPVFYYGSLKLLQNRCESNVSPVCLHFLSLVLSYLPTYIQTMSWCFKDGYRIKSVQNHWIWKYFGNYFSSTIALEEPLDPKQLYIFCVFPHGACTLNHFITMTDCNKMLTQHFPAERRDLSATILFLIPVVKDVSLSSFLSFYYPLTFCIL
jgi:hypothetical protein